MQPGRSSRSALFPSFGQAVLLVIAMLVVQFGLGFAIGIAGALIPSEPGGMSALATNPWILGVLNMVAIGAVLAVGLRMTRERAARFFTIRRFDLSLLPPVVLTSLSLAVVIDQTAKIFFEAMSRFPGLPVEDLSEALMAVHPIGGFLLVVGVAPVTEEYLFRGMILRGLLTRHRAWVAVIVSAVLFGVMHANLLQFHLGVIIGCVFGWWFVRTGSVAPGLIGHAVFNGVSYFSTLFPQHMAPLGSSSGPDIVHQPAWFTLTAVAFAALGVWWFKGRADALGKLGVAGGWEDSIPDEPAPVGATVPALPPQLDGPPVLELPAPEVPAQEQPARLELGFQEVSPPPVPATEPPVLEPQCPEPPLLEPPALPPKAPVV